MRRFVSITLLTFVLAALPLCAQEQQADPAQSITQAELRDHMYFLASDALGGRLVGTDGYEIAARYCASQFRAAGLETIVKDAEGGDSYLQHIPMVKRQVTEAPPLLLDTPDGQIQFAHGDSYKLIVLTESGQLPPVVFAGYGIEEPDHGWNDFEGVDIAGKTVVLLNGAPVRDGEPVLPAEDHARYGSPQGAQAKIVNIFQKQPAAIVLVADQQLLAIWQVIPSEFSSPSYTVAGEERSREGGPTIPTILVIKPDVAGQLFAGQQYNPAQIAEQGLEGYTSFELEGAGFTLALDSGVEEEEFDSWNVVALVRGTDPELADEWITVGAHLDHIGLQNGQVCNGADDNASGCIGALEIAEAVAMAPPRRSVIFILYTSEDVSPGLTGSAYFVGHCPVPIEDVMVNLNMDMIGRTTPENSETRAHIVVVPEGPSEQLWPIIEEVNARTVNWALNRLARTESGSSDHANFQRSGIPVAAFFSGFHQDLHRPTDDADKIEYDKMQAISQLVYGIVMELGNRDEPLSR